MIFRNPAKKYHTNDTQKLFVSCASCFTNGQLQGYGCDISHYGCDILMRIGVFATNVLKQLFIFYKNPGDSV